MSDPAALRTVVDAPASREAEAKLSDRLYRHILEGIVEGAFAPDTRLPSEAELARRFTVSRPVVREALARLRDHGVVVSRQGSGSWVRRRPDRSMPSFAPVGSIADVQRCFEFRTTFEGRAAALAAERHDKPALARIEAAYTALEAVLATDGLGVDADLAFHKAIADAARNHFFSSTLAMLEDQISTGMTVTRNLSLRHRAERLRLVQDEHLRVVEAIRGRDAAAAERAMVLHIDNARRRMLEGDGGAPPADATGSRPAATRNG